MKLDQKTLEAFALLELNIRATPEEAKKTFRKWVKICHPDQYPEDAARQQSLTEQLKKIIEAYRLICIYLEKKITYPSGNYFSPPNASFNPSSPFDPSGPAAPTPKNGPAFDPNQSFHQAFSDALRQTHVRVPNPAPNEARSQERIKVRAEYYRLRGQLLKKRRQYANGDCGDSVDPVSPVGRPKKVGRI